MSQKFYDPMFYLCSDKMPFTIRIEISLTEKVDIALMTRAANTAIKRFPYFRMTLVRKGNELVVEPNDKPIVVYEGNDYIPINDERINGHLVAIAVDDKTVHFMTTHVITDGCGFIPFMKSVLYYYYCYVTGETLDPTGIYLADEPLYDDEIANPFPEDKMANAEPMYTDNGKPYLKYAELNNDIDNKPTIFRFRIKESDVVRFSHDNDASPCALFSALMSQAVMDVHPDNEKDIISAVSFNYRGALGNKHNYRMLCNALRLRYPKRTADYDITRLCTCTRGMISLQSQPENALYYAQNMKEGLERVIALPDVESKQKALMDKALYDSVDTTFSISYVGRISFGSVEKYITSMRNYTDGSTYESSFIEMSAINGWVFINFFQSFSNDVYYKALLNRLKLNNIEYIEEASGELILPSITLPL